MKKISSLLAVAALALAFTVVTHAQTITSGSSTFASTNIVVQVVPQPPPAPVAIVHRVVVPPSISVTLAPALLAQLDPQAPAGNVVKRMIIVGNADGSFTATITYVATPTP